jgi:NADH-quinone oxidoreductase subunit J
MGPTDIRMYLGGAAALFGVGMWLLLPAGGRGGKAVGAILLAMGIGLLGLLSPRLESIAETSAFQTLSAVTIFAAVATVVARNPVYSVIWFALTLLGTAGVMLFQGAQFLAVATIVVYAGAILVTFLFVLMLAQPKGTAGYDRLSWDRAISALTSAVLVTILTATVFSVARPWKADQSPPLDPNSPAQLTSTGQRVLADQHMAQLGGQLFSRHLLAVEIAGTLLMVGLVGAVVIVAHGNTRESTGEIENG